MTRKRKLVIWFSVGFIFGIVGMLKDIRTLSHFFIFGAAGGFLAIVLGLIPEWKKPVSEEEPGGKINIRRAARRFLKIELIGHLFLPLFIVAYLLVFLKPFGHLISMVIAWVFIIVIVILYFFFLRSRVKEFYREDFAKTPGIGQIGYGAYGYDFPMKDSLLMLLFILLGIALLVGGMLVYENSISPKETGMGQTESQTLEQILPNKTAGWQTYSNPDANFTFKYPENWEIRESYFYKDNLNPTIVVCREEEPKEIYKNCIQINMPQFPCETQSNVRGNWVGICVEDPTVVEVYKKIVATLKFAEDEASLPAEDSATESWKTYRDEQYGFEVKYPEGWYSFPFTFLEIERVVFQNLPGEETEIKLEETALKDLYRLEIKIIEGEIDDWLEKQEVLSQRIGIKFSKEKATFGGKEGYKIISETLDGEEAAFMVLFKNGKLYLIETLWPEECGTAEWIGDCEVFDQILSTFRFLE